MQIRFMSATGRAMAMACLLAITSTLAMSANLTSTKFDTTVQLHGTPLVLNGVGTPEELLALPGPKRLSFVALREISGTDLGLAFLKGLQANAAKDQVQKHTTSSTRLIDIFSGQSKLMPGDSFAMDFVSGSGTTFYIAGKPQGAPVGDAEFFNMVLKIWVGSSPADFMLKDALLGQESKTAR